MFPSLEGCHHCFQMREASQGHVFCEDMEIHLIELTKFSKELKDLVDGYDQWLYLIRHAQDLDPLNPPKQFTVSEVLVTLKDLEIMAHTEQERYQNEARERAIQVKKSRQNFYLRQREEGRREGRIEERQVWLRKAKLVCEINAEESKLTRQVSSPGDLLKRSEEDLVQLLKILGEK
jgi:flagellar biosynthesis/type III secretory pathway protein FliH